VAHVRPDELFRAEQDERRRIALFLHDGPVQSLSGIALMLDAAVHALEDGNVEQARQIITGTLDRQRETIRSLRDLSFALEPVVLRDQGFGPAMHELAQQVGMSHEIQVELDIEPAERLAERAQVGLYQIIRESISSAVRRGSPTKIEVRITEAGDGAFEACIADDGASERRQRFFEVIEERAAALQGTVTIDPRDEGEGTVVKVSLPSYTAR
jgi:signal transduction histidine kinase